MSGERGNGYIVLVVWTSGRFVAIGIALYCIRCQYDLRLLRSHVCPECGQPFDPADKSTFRDTLPRSRKPFVFAGVVVLLTLAGSWLLGFIQMSRSTVIDVDFGVATSQMNLGDRLALSLLVALVPTVAAGLLAMLALWLYIHVARRG